MSGDILTQTPDGAADFQMKGAAPASEQVNGHAVDAKPAVRTEQPKVGGEGTPVFDAKVNGHAVNGARRNGEPTFHDLIQKALATPGAERVMTGVDAAAASGLRPVRTRESVPTRTVAPRRIVGK